MREFHKVFGLTIDADPTVKLLQLRRSLSKTSAYSFRALCHPDGGKKCLQLRSFDGAPLPGL